MYYIHVLLSTVYRVILHFFNSHQVYLELPDGGLHDLEQRIDQLQHMQVTFRCWLAWA